MKRILINACQTGEVRIAITDKEQLIDLDIETFNKEQKKGNIYKAKISRIEPSLNAAFVNYGEDKNGFLPYKEISPQYFKKKSVDQEAHVLDDVLDVGQELIVQITKEERGTKGAALTTFITLAGCYMILMPTSADAGGISRRIQGKERDNLKALLNTMSIPENMGVIVRTAGLNRSIDEMQSDLNSLVNLWASIKINYSHKKAPFLIHKEGDIFLRTLRDYLKDDISEIIVDDKKVYELLKDQLNILRLNFAKRLQLYGKSFPLFSAFQIEKQVESAFSREINLSSGGSITIDLTEALTAIDINSARSTGADSIEDTALSTNLEAAAEIAKQLRIRDLGGLIVVDFIDMSLAENQKSVEQRLVALLSYDRAKIQMTRISKFGLVEISRQRLRASLNETAMYKCPRCEGNGVVRSITSISMLILRNIYNASSRNKSSEITVEIPIDIAAFLLNEKRSEISSIENSTATKISLIPNSSLQVPQYNIHHGGAFSNNKSVEMEKNPSKSFSATENKWKQRLRPAQKNKFDVSKSTKNKGFFCTIYDNLLGFKSIFGSTFSVIKRIMSFNHSKKYKIHDTKKSYSNKFIHPTSTLQNNAGNRKNKIAFSDENRNKVFSAKRGSKNIQRVQIFSSEEALNIGVAKQNQNNLSVVDKKSLMKVISTNPQEKISPMVQKMMGLLKEMCHNDVEQVETRKQDVVYDKYLKFETVCLSLSDKDDNQNHAVLDSKSTKEQQQANCRLQNSNNATIKNVAEKHANFPYNSNYSISADVVSQGFIKTK